MADPFYRRERFDPDDQGPGRYTGRDDRYRGSSMEESRHDEDVRHRPSADERWRPPVWGRERSYSSGREYGDRDYGLPGGDREYGWRPDDRPNERWPTEPPSARYAGARSGTYDPARPDYSGYVDLGRQGYGGPYGRERSGAREWSSTEGWRVPGPYTGRGPRGYQRTDQRIEEELHERLTAHGRIDATDVECRVSNGEVTLTGFVDSREARRAAEDVAEDIYGVRQVNNQLRVRSHADDSGVGRTSVLGLTESQTQTRHSPADPGAGPGRSRTGS